MTIRRTDPGRSGMFQGGRTPPKSTPQPGGGGGGGKKGGGKRHRAGRGGGGIRRDAKRDVGLAIRPELREIRNAKRGLKRDYRGYANQMGGLYGILGRELGGIGGQMSGEFDEVQGDYTQGVESIMSALGQTTAPDQAGFLNTLGSFALAGQNDLSTDASREVAWNASNQRQGGLESMVLQRNIRGDLQEGLDDLRTARRDVIHDRGPMLMQRMDQLREQQFARSMALKELALRRQALAQAGAGASGYANYVSGYPVPRRSGGPNHPNPTPTPTTPAQRRRKGGGTVVSGFGGGYDPRQTGN